MAEKSKIKIMDKKDYIKNHSQLIKHVYRILGYYISLNLKDTKITPNIITFTRIPLVILAGIFLLFNSTMLNIFSSILLILFSALDAADGILSKMQSKSSVFGTWLDIQVDRIGLLIIIIFLSLENIILEKNNLYIILYFACLSMMFIKDFDQEEINDKDKLRDLKNKYISNLPSINDVEKPYTITFLNYQSNNNFIRNIIMILKNIFLQTNPHNHNFVIYICIGILFSCVNFIFLLLFFYILLVYGRNIYVYFKR